MNEESQAILVLLLANISDEYDKSIGSFIYDSLAAVAIEMAKTDVSIDDVIERLSIENLIATELAQRVQERTGIIRKVATSATGSVALTGSGTISIGDLFETPGGIQFQSTETKVITASGSVVIQAVIAGSSGVVPTGTITLFPVTLAGFTAVTNASSTQDGFEAESDADLLLRYYDRVQTPATSGNKSHYKNWAKEVTGVGDARIIPLWNGNNTVKIVIIDSNKIPASASITTAAQSYIDPGVTGLGDGASQIGAFATVISATGVNINVVVTIALSSGYTQQQATDNITVNLTQLLKDIAFIESIVSYAKVGAAILSSDGVEDYSGLTVNGGTANVSIGNESVAVLGTVIVSVP